MFHVDVRGIRSNIYNIIHLYWSYISYMVYFCGEKIGSIHDLFVQNILGSVSNDQWSELRSEHLYGHQISVAHTF
jgi:hypothetical protein